MAGVALGGGKCGIFPASNQVRICTPSKTSPLRFGMLRRHWRPIFLPNRVTDTLTARILKTKRNLGMRFIKVLWRYTPQDS